MHHGVENGMYSPGYRGAYCQTGSHEVVSGRESCDNMIKGTYGL